MERCFLVEVRPREGLLDREAIAVMGTLAGFGVDSISSVRATRLFELRGELDLEDARRIACELLADPVAEAFDVLGPEGMASRPDRPRDELALTVARGQGVMDPAIQSAEKALRDLGLFTRVRSIRASRRYYLRGSLNERDRDLVERRVLANPVIEGVFEWPAMPPPEKAPAAARCGRVVVPLGELERANRVSQLALSALELEAIARYYREDARRDPTEIELETIAQTWSEHCKHKTFAGAVRYAGPLGSWQDPGCPRGEKLYRSLLKETIFAATSRLVEGRAGAPFCLSVFEDNAGVVAFDEELGVCMKVETHNHPSALEPYGGAGTGVGGVVRDVLGTGLGAKPIANTDVFCFAAPDLPIERVPPGALHPRQLLRGVVAGVRDYGNRMGIPTVNGAIVFDERYAANPLVFCGTVGLVPRSRIAKAARSGDAIVLAGGRTGRDGIHGATFSSLELSETSERTSSGAVQIGNAIEEKRLEDVLIAARDRGLLRAVTDCGAGGLSSAVGEMAHAPRLGAEVDLERVPLKYQGLSPAEIWISEAQERMVLAVPPERTGELLSLFAAEDVEATVIGRFIDDERLELRFSGECVGSLDQRFLHEGLPRIERAAHYEPPCAGEPHPGDYAPRGAAGRYDDDLLAILSSWNVCSKEWVVRQYDHEVQGRSAVKPFVGASEEGPSDAAVLVPRRATRRGIAISCGLNPRYGDIDPWRMGAAAVDEALRNAVAVGADPDRAAILDNFAWGDGSLEDRLGSLVLAAEGAAAAAVCLRTPFISGKDSLNNEFRVGSSRLAIPGTLLVSCLAIVPDVARSVTMDLKCSGDAIYLVGTTLDELGGSHLHLVRGIAGGRVPRLDGDRARSTFRAVHAAIRAGVVRACHDLSEGGLATAAAEMAFAGGLGLELAIDADPGNTQIALFSESCSRFLLEVPGDVEAALGEWLEGIPYGRLGTVTPDPRLHIHDRSGRSWVDLPLAALRDASRRVLPRALGEPLIP